MWIRFISHLFSPDISSFYFKKLVLHGDRDRVTGDFLFNLVLSIKKKNELWYVTHLMPVPFAESNKTQNSEVCLFFAATRWQVIAQLLSLAVVLQKLKLTCIAMSPCPNVRLRHEHALLSTPSATPFSYHSYGVKKSTKSSFVRFTWPLSLNGWLILV